MNELEGMTLEEQYGLAEHLVQECPPEDVSALKDALEEPPDVLAHTLRGTISTLFWLETHKKTHFHNGDAITLPESKRSDRALERTQRALASMTDEKWVASAKKVGMDPDVYRREKWASVYRSFMND